jgi:very-short-patch-repair endonuclease
MEKRTPQAAGLAQCFRKTATQEEKTIWAYLRRRGVAHCKFRRQHPLGPYILDFYCHALKLAIELDGAINYTPGGAEHDAVRAKYLAAHGVTVLRFENRQVRLEPWFVDREIRATIRKLRGY